jgi:cystathionine gamma-synthase
MTQIPLGTPLPTFTEHAVSVSLPTWADVVGYEEGKPEVLGAFKTAYPRFFFHPYVSRLMQETVAKQGRPGEACLIFPSKQAAEQAHAYLARREISARILPQGYGSLYSLFFAQEALCTAKQFWQHAGLIISSRLAQAALENTPQTEANAEKLWIRQDIATYLRVAPNDIFLFPSGMGAVYAVHEALIARKPGIKTIQLGFPYVDMLKIQERFGTGVHYVPYQDAEDLQAVEALLTREKFAGVFCEFPGNPLLQSIDLEKLSALLRRYGVPLVIDDTVATFYNVDLTPYADALVSSLTKFYSGVGDVIAGSLALIPSSPFYAELHHAMKAGYEDLLWPEDAKILRKNGEGFAARMEKINGNALALARHLKGQEAIAQVYYPALVPTHSIYDRYKKPEGGYGGLLSIVLKDATQAPAYYDRLAIAKGPSLGTEFTLACPYTLLAHYHELAFAESSGVAAHLIRVSVGVEPIEALTRLFT